ncbi:hypothetical protein [Mycolicibacterium stellerae]|uniref:hypothetical protein n=1 Tax=Mycolicibacterium stellerae TaxID=2358193 RepID=UPI0013DE0EAE|nr:hypothetical protein [Mycolicibacterium stellerae]
MSIDNDTRDDHPRLSMAKQALERLLEAAEPPTARNWHASSTAVVALNVSKKADGTLLEELVGFAIPASATLVLGLRTENDWLITEQNEAVWMVAACEVCEFQATDYDGLAHHVMEMHPGNYAVTCASCDIKIVGASAVVDHFNQLHSDALDLAQMLAEKSLI